MGRVLISQRAVVLGPRPGPDILGPMLESLDLPPGPVATLSVGWRESDIEAAGFPEGLPGCGRALEPLALGERVRRAFARDKELSQAHAELQTGVRAEEALYGARLRQAVEAARAVERVAVPDRYREPYTREAWRSLLATDRFHFDSQRRCWREFRERLRPLERPALRAERDEVLDILDGAAAVLITGGHVAMIRNRMLLLELGEALAQRTLVAWSGGAMALTRQVVLFHHRLPHGSAEPEILGDGLGLLPGVALFPDARLRLPLSERGSLADLAGRVAPEVAVLLDDGDRLEWNGRRWSAPSGMRILGNNGEILEVESLP